MTRSLGKLARVDHLDVASKLKFTTGAECMGLPVASTGSIELKDANISAKRIEVTQDGSTEGRFVVMNNGTVYSKSQINPSFVDSPIQPIVP